MSDNVEFQAVASASLPAGTVFATDDVDGVQYQRVKLDLGGDGLSEPVTDLATEAAQTAGNVLLEAISDALTNYLTRFPAALGQGTMAQSLPVAIASNQGALTVSSHAVTNAGTFPVQVDGAALTSLQLLDDAIVLDDSAFTPATTKVLMAGFVADDTATDTVSEDDGGAARMTFDRKQIVTPQPHTLGGLSIHRSIDLDEGTLEVVKNSPGCVYGMWACNTATTTRFIKFYDATSGTAGTGTPVITIPIPGNVSDDISANFGANGHGIQFSTGICVGATTDLADAGTGAPSANDVIVNIFFK